MNKKWKQELRKTGSIIVSIALLGNLTACGAESSGYAEAGDILNMEEETLKEVLTASVAPAHSSTDGKEEIVYVLADAEGGVNKVIVSDWLKCKRRGNIQPGREYGFMGYRRIGYLLSGNYKGRSSGSG